MPPFPRRACAAVLVLCASLLGAVAPASAAEDPAARLVVPETVEVKTATGSEGLEAGTRYWELDVEPLGVGYADYVGSWENVDGMWESPDAVHDYFARGGLRPAYVGDVAQRPEAGQDAPVGSELEHAPGDDMADLAVGQDDPHLDRDAGPLRVLDAVGGELGPIVGMAVGVQGLQVERPL